MDDRIQELKKKRAGFRIFYGLMAAYLLFSLVLLYRMRMLGLIAALLAPLWYLVFLRPALKRFETEKRILNMELAYGGFLDAIIPKADHVILREDVDAAGLIPTQEKGFLSLNGFTGTFRKLPVAAGEISNYHRLDLKNPKSNRLLFLTGTFVKLKLSVDTGMNLRALSLGLLAAETRKVFFEEQQGLKKVLLPEGSLKQKFILYDGSGEIPDSEIQNGLLKLRAASRDNIAVSIQGNLVSIFLQNSFLACDSHVYDEITDAGLKAVRCPELKAALLFSARLASGPLPHRIAMSDPV